MNYRVSQLDNSEVDELRFDRIKIQRMRMEHILEVIKDLTFKNKELLRFNAQLRQEAESERSYKQLYQQVCTERKVLMEKNAMFSNELSRYRETALNQEMLINTLKEQVSCIGFRDRQFRDHFQTQPAFIYKSGGENQKSMFAEEYEILRAQYDDLQSEYSQLFQQYYSKDKHNSKDKQNMDLTGHIYQAKRDRSGHKTQYLLKNVKSNKDLRYYEQDETINLQKLRNKYSKLKKTKKQLVRWVRELQSKLQGCQLKEDSLLQLIEMLKNTKTTICRCHINKFEKQLQLKSMILQKGC